jgi:hypothetical protein
MGHRGVGFDWSSWHRFRLGSNAVRRRIYQRRPRILVGKLKKITSDILKVRLAQTRAQLLDIKSRDGKTPSNNNFHRRHLLQMSHFWGIRQALLPTENRTGRVAR